MRGLILVLLLVVSGPAHSVVSDPVSIAKLVELINQAKQQLRKLKSSLDELQATNETLAKAKDTLKSLRDEYEFVSNFDPEQEMRSLQGEVEDVVNVFSLKDFIEAKDTAKRFDIFLDEMDKRIKNLSPEQADELLAARKRRDMLIAMRDYYLTHGIEGKSQAPSEKDLTFVTASSTAILASEALNRQVKETEQAIQIQENRLRELEHQHRMLRFYRGEP